jgi:hypothetical protein
VLAHDLALAPDPAGRSILSACLLYVCSAKAGTRGVWTADSITIFRWRYFHRLEAARRGARHRDIPSLLHRRQLFGEIFWNEPGGYLYDCIDGEARDARLRPNQLLVLALPFPWSKASGRERSADRGTEAPHSGRLANLDAGRSPLLPPLRRQSS